MDSIYPAEIQGLPRADVPMAGADAFLFQGDNQQIVFTQYSEEIEIPEHSHEAQWGVVLEGTIEFVVKGQTSVYTKGDRYYIPEGVPHSSKVHANYADILFFNQKARFKAKA
jgi:quercetin dioxygenase-like cupin family protein